MNHSKIKGNVKRLFESRREKKVLEKIIEEETRTISNYMFCEGKKEIEILLDDDETLCIEPKVVKVTVSTSKTINFIVEKLKEKLSKEIFDDVVTREYYIEDMEGLVEYLKSCGVRPKVFKKYIRRVDKLNKERFYKYYDFGDIKLEDLKGCYSIKESKPSVRVTEQK